MKEKIKVLLHGDGPIPLTGFGRVLTNIFGNLSRSKYEISWLAINYYGDPNSFQNQYKLYPASSKGNLWGHNRLLEVIDREKPDLIFMLNDMPVIAEALRTIKNGMKLESIPKIVVYFPVDSKYPQANWFENYDIVTAAYTYSEFGKFEVDLVAPEVNVQIVYHGVDTKTFYQLSEDRNQVRSIIFKNLPDHLNDYWIMGSFNRNSPRKRLDIALKGFALFSENKDESVKCLFHCGLIDGGVPIIELAQRFGMKNRLFVTNEAQNIQTVSDEKLNYLYNACNVGINTSHGEGLAISPSPC